ncbi:MAG: hypothetical protein ACKOC5_05775 [Chloroflexota bacterium]
MHKPARLLLFFLTLALLPALSGCRSADPAAAPQAIEQYLNALVARDQNAMIAASCAAWEAQARQEFDSFAAVKLELKDLACQAGEQDGETMLVNCQGEIVANYGAENLSISLERTYQALNEGGEWRMCGYR